MALPNNGRPSSIKPASLRREFQNRQIVEIDNAHLGVMISGTLCIVAKDIAKLRFLRSRYTLASELLVLTKKGDMGGLGRYFTPSELSEEAHQGAYMVFADTHFEPDPKLFGKTVLLGFADPSTRLWTRRGFLKTQFLSKPHPEEGAKGEYMFSGRNSRVGTVTQRSDASRALEVFKEKQRESYRFAVLMQPEGSSTESSRLVAEAVEMIYDQEFVKLNAKLLQEAAYMRGIYPNWLATFGTRKSVTDADLDSYRKLLGKQLSQNLYDSEDARETADSAIYDRDTLHVTLQAKVQTDPRGPQVNFVATFQVWP
jgi:hypothetical protein